MAYNILPKFQLVNAQSMAATFTSNAQEHKEQDNAGIQIQWTGSPTGEFSVQVSIDHAQDSQGNITVAGTWTTLSLSNPILAAGSADNAYIEINQLSAPYFRVVYTRTSGTGTANVFVGQKGV